jgi:hypothetical protein
MEALCQLSYSPPHHRRRTAADRRARGPTVVHPGRHAARAGARHHRTQAASATQADAAHDDGRLRGSGARGDTERLGSRGDARRVRCRTVQRPRHGRLRGRHARRPAGRRPRARPGRTDAVDERRARARRHRHGHHRHRAARRHRLRRPDRVGPRPLGRLPPASTPQPHACPGCPPDRGSGRCCSANASAACAPRCRSA